MDIARSVQEVTEEIVLKMARHVRKVTQKKYLCLAGGVALNCVSNGKLLRSGIFDDIYIDKSLPSDNAPTRKPGIGLLKKYINNKNYDLENSYVIGDRLTDMELALNLGAKGIFISNDEKLVEAKGDVLTKETEDKIQ